MTDKSNPLLMLLHSYKEGVKLMGLIGNEIIQSRVWVEPTKTPPPNLNYKQTFPITVFDAVRRDMDNEDSPTLTYMLNKIFEELKSKQPIISGKPANNLMTFAGAPGAVGAIRISQDIPWDPEQQLHDRIPTEKAVGDLLLKLGLVNEDGSVDGSGEGKKVRWSDIVGRPNIYPNLGLNEDGIATQKCVTEAINALDSQLTEHESTVAVKFDNIKKRIDMHTSAVNPHNITADQVGAVPVSTFDFHLADDNPHKITANTIGLGNVDNTRDIDKPISIATQEALDAINDLIGNMTDDVGGLKFVVNIEYNQSTGTLTWIYNNGSRLSLTIPIDGLVDEIQYDKDTKELVINELGGTVKRVDISDMFIRYIGSEGNNVLVEIEGDQTTGNQIIKARIAAKGVTDEELADSAVITRTIADQSVTGGKIHDLTITTIKYANQSVTTEKIAELAITNGRLDNRAVDGRVIFSSNVNDKILAVREAGSDPIWTQIVADMISLNAVQTGHIKNGAVTSDKLGNKSVITARIDDLAVTNEKLAANSVTNDKVATASIEGLKLVENPEFSGIPRITKRPAADSNINEVPDTRWVKDTIRDMEITNKNLGDRIVDGRSLFTSPTKNRALLVFRANSDPVWGLINNGMMDADSINTANIMNLAVTAEKLHDKSIQSRHMTSKAVQTDHIADNAVTSEKLFRSGTANVVLASLEENGNPVYAQVKQEMIEHNAVGTLQIADRNVTMSKIQSSDENQRVLAVGLKNSDPRWMQVANKMIADRAVDGRTLFTSSGQDVILAVTTPGVDPAWLKVNGNMLQERLIKKHHIEKGAIWSEHLQENIIEAKHLVDWSIKSTNIAPRAITGGQLFTSALPHRVLGVGSTPYSDATWLQVGTEMLEDLSITKDKIFQSDHPYRVLGATQAGVPPEYLMITHQFIVDGTITANKLEPNFVLHGTPELTSDPLPDANNYQLPSTRWVRKTIAAIMKDFNPEILFDTIDATMIQNHSIDGSKLMTHPYGPRVLGITKANEEVEFILIEEDLIANSAVTTNKLQRSIHLLGSPTLEIRPSPGASDATGTGSQVPDCQWVIDRIREASFGGGSGGGGSIGDFIIGPIPNDRVEGIVDGVVQPERSDIGCDIGDATIGPIPSDRIEGIIDGVVQPEGSGTIIGGGDDPSDDPSAGGSLLPNSVGTEYIMNRAVTGEKLFTTAYSNLVLAVTEPNTDPKYAKVSQDMLEKSRIIDPQRLFTSRTSNVVLTVRAANSNPEYAKINNYMLENNIIKTEQIVDRAVTGEKLANFSITADKIANSAIIRTNHIYDQAVTTDKIAEHAVERDKIADKAIDGTKLADSLELPAYTTVAAHTDYERQSLRNTILSPNAPKGGSNGVIWFRYI